MSKRGASHEQNYLIIDLRQEQSSHQQDEIMVKDCGLPKPFDRTGEKAYNPAIDEGIRNKLHLPRRPVGTKAVNYM